MKKVVKLIKSNIIFALIVVVSSCSYNEIIDEVDNNRGAEGRFSSTGLIKLGEKLPDPYSLDNMQKAMDQLKQEGLIPNDYGSATLTPTHKYVRFLPANVKEFYLLTDSLQLMLFDHCLLMEVVENGHFYIDPDVGYGQITWQYTTVDVNFEFPDVTYEIIHYCYIPEDTKSDDNAFNTLLEERAVKISGYYKNFPSFQENENISKSIQSSSTPKGTIRFRDPWNNQISPAKGVTVRCWVGAKIARGETNAQGYYNVGRSFTFNPYYRVYFYHMDDWSVKNNFIAIHDAYNHGLGYQSKSGYSHTFNDIDNSRTPYFCLISTAAYDYYLWCFNNQISRPPANLRIWAASYLRPAAPMLKRGVVAFYRGANAMNHFYNSLIIPGNATIQIVNAFTDMVPDVTLNRESNQLYRTTVHELAHASHYAKAGWDYWCTYASYIVTCYIDGEDLYGHAGLPNSGVCGVGEMWGYYIGGVFAMNRYGDDSNNQNQGGNNPGRIWFSGDGEWFSPRILRRLTFNGVLTEGQIFQCLTNDIRSHEQLRNRLISSYGNRTQIEAAFTAEGF